MKLTRPSTPEPAAVPPIDIAAALAVLFPGIDCDRDVELRDDGAGVCIARWNRAEPQPSEEALRAVEIPAPVLTLTARQARLWLLSAGLDDAAIRAQIATIPDGAQRAAALVEWEYSVTIHSDHPLVLQVASGLGLDAAQLRAAFVSAANL
jgi:XkdW protein